MIRIALLVMVVLLTTAHTASAYTCAVTTAPAPLNFGNLDPALGTDVIVTTVVNIRCTGAGQNPITFTVTDDDGLYETGANANRMSNSTYPSEYLPYSFTYTTPVSGNKGQVIPVTITGTVLGTLYQNASLGAYIDRVTITVAP